jgi:hypothetical protein
MTISSLEGAYEAHVRPPARFVEIPDPTDPAELDAIRDFTYPCAYCVPGARESLKSLPIVFESPDERDPEADWTHWAVVIRNEPSPLPFALRQLKLARLMERG